MRLAGAVLVLASHAWVLVGRAADEPFAPLLGRYTDGGGLAVAMFFVLSGFLIARSVERAVAGGRKGLIGFVRARALRLYPALVAALLVQIFLIGALATTMPLPDYLADRLTWSALARSLAFSPPLGLPAVFAGNPLPLAVNGSLWTLRLEVLCYAGLLGLGWLGLLRPARLPLVLLAGVSLLLATMAARAGLLPPVLASLKLVSVIDCLVHFLAGAAFWVYRDRIARRPALALVGVALLVAASGTPAAPLLFHLVLPYLVLVLGLTRPVASGLLLRTGDLSYGIYLYAFPIEQGLVAWLGPGIGPLGLAAAALPPTLLCAALSWRLVETRAIRWRAPAGPAPGRRTLVRLAR